MRLKIIILLAMIGLPLFAQNDYYQSEEIAIGVEVSTAGVGLELNLPFSLDNTLVLRVGYTGFPYTFKKRLDMDYFGAKAIDLDALVNSNPQIKEYLVNNGYPTSTDQLDQTIMTKVKTGLNNSKVLLDYYPFSKSSFHITAGAYFGQDYLLKMKGQLSDQMVQLTNGVRQVLPGYTPTARIGDYIIVPDENGVVEASLQINNIKPYLGIGFGRSIPKRDVAFVFDLGVMYIGKIDIVSTNGEVIKSPNPNGSNTWFDEVIEKCRIYPMVSFRITGRLF